LDKLDHPADLTLHEEHLAVVPNVLQFRVGIGPYSFYSNLKMYDDIFGYGALSYCSRSLEIEQIRHIARHDGIVMHWPVFLPLLQDVLPILSQNLHGSEILLELESSR
jgi:hypothetical protein